MSSDPSVNHGADESRARFVRASMPPGGLFAGQDWRIAGRPFPLGAALAAELEKLGRILLQFNKAANLLYRLSAQGRQPEWVAALLDQGKPSELIALQRDPAFKNEVPRVLRPDLLLTDEGLAITELDSVPGGIGLTGWLNEAYACPDPANPTVPAPSVVGGPTGMMEGFASIFGDAPKVHIVVSEEAATYRPEMEWISRKLGSERFCVHGGEFDGAAAADGDAVYRFFELFDLPNVSGSARLFQSATAKTLQLTPPVKPLFEEKLLLALLWNRNLRGFWRQELGEGFLDRLQKLVPYTWVIDPAPMPPHAAIPELGLTDWHQLKALSQRERALVLKVSGFSDQAWGARSVTLGSDVPVGEWSAAVDNALRSFPVSPFVLQRFHRPRVVDFEWFDFAANTFAAMPGRVRLCPYYFVSGRGDEARAKLGGVLATICPADKKIIHGMRDAVLAPCSI